MNKVQYGKKCQDQDKEKKSFMFYIPWGALRSSELSAVLKRWPADNLWKYSIYPTLKYCFPACSVKLLGLHLDWYKSNFLNSTLYEQIVQLCKPLLCQSKNRLKYTELKLLLFLAHFLHSVLEFVWFGGFFKHKYMNFSITVIKSLYVALHNG